MTKFCPECGHKNKEDVKFCEECGHRFEETPEKAKVKKTGSKERSAGIAVILSFFVIGLGQIYNGEVGKGIIFFVTGVILNLLTLYIFFFGLPFLFVMWLINLYDAYSEAKKTQQ